MVEGSGCGPLGLGCVVGAVTKGALNVIALDMNDKKLELAKQMGANHAFNIKKVDALAEVLKLTDGDGCDVYVEAVRSSSSETFPPILILFALDWPSIRGYPGADHVAQTGNVPGIFCVQRPCYL